MPKKAIKKVRKQVYIDKVAYETGMSVVKSANKKGGKLNFSRLVNVLLLDSIK